MAASKGNQFAKGNKGGGRHTDYKNEYVDMVFKFCLLGATDAQLADFFDVSETTINNWEDKHEEFSLALKKGKIFADAEIAEALYHRAKGYTHMETKVFQSDGSILTYDVMKHYPPDTGAAMAWLKNRQSGKWRDNKEVIIREEEPETLEEIEKRLTDLRAKTESII